MGHGNSCDGSDDNMVFICGDEPTTLAKTYPARGSNASECATPSATTKPAIQIELCICVAFARRLSEPPHEKHGEAQE
jgi:hypothetical protein